MSVAVDTARPEGDTEAPRRRRIRPGDIVFLVFFIAFSAGGLLALVMGVGSVLASISDPLHDSLHIRALGTGFLARSALRMADAAHEVGSWPQVAFDYAFSILNFALAIFLLWLRPRDRTARLLAVGIIGTAGAFNLTANTAVEIVPLAGIETFGFFAAQTIGGLAYVYALLFFPDGRPVPRWPWPALVPLYAVITVPVVLLVLRVEGTRRPATLLLIFGLLVPIVGALSQAYRFRRSETQTEHAQARLLFWALTPALGVGIFFVLTQGFGGVTDPGFAGRHLPEQPVEVFRIFQPVFLLVPVALFFGLQRYRLWDIDRVVNRTLVWALASGLVFGLSFGLVIVLQRVLNPFTAGNDIAVALTTLLAVALFIPVRRRIQEFVDRRFYRQRYDAQRTIEAFSSRLRDELDLEALGFELRGAVLGTMQPSHVTLLLREPDGGLGWQWTYRGRDS